MKILILILVAVSGLFAVDYQTEIQPIFSGNCGGCHTTNSQAGLNLSSYEAVMDGSNNGAVIIAGDHEASLLWQRISNGSMPPNNNDLSSSQVQLIADWIDEGALAEEEEELNYNEITISGNSFSPANLTIEIGDSVRWTNTDNWNHTTTADNGEWDSGNLANGETFAYVFSEGGTFNYHCGIHSSMTAVIQVGELSSSTFSAIPEEIILNPAYPNPFNPETIISWNQPISNNTRLEIYNLNGALVENLSDSHYSAGLNHIQWQPENFNSGIYFLRIQCGNFLATQKLVYLK